MSYVHFISQKIVLLNVKSHRDSTIRLILMILAASAIAAVAALSFNQNDVLDAIVRPAIDRQIAQIISEQNKRYTALQQENEKLKADISRLNERASSLEGYRTYTISALGSLEKRPAYLNDSGNYGIARTAHGPVLLAVEKVQPYLDGYKVTLSVGNITAANYTGAAFDVSWGLPLDLKKYTAEEYSKSQKIKIFSSIVNFNSGSYTYVDATLTPAKPEEIKEITVGIEFNRISLRKPAIQ